MKLTSKANLIELVLITTRKDMIVTPRLHKVGLARLESETTDLSRT